MALRETISMTEEPPGEEGLGESGRGVGTAETAWERVGLATAPEECEFVCLEIQQTHWGVSASVFQARYCFVALATGFLERTRTPRLCKAQRQPVMCDSIPAHVQQQLRGLKYPGGCLAWAGMLQL